MRVLVCGGRDYGDRAEVFSTLDQIHAVNDIRWIVHGACSIGHELRGADRWAEEWAIDRQVPYVGWPAPFKKMMGPGGPWRNQRMLDHTQPDLVIAFPGEKGTASMVSKARAAGVNVLEIPGSRAPSGRGA